jgi:hypothetical protein
LLIAAMTSPLLTSPQPLHHPEWGFTAIICGIGFGSMGTMLSGMHLAREEHDRVLAAATMFVNGAAIALAAVGAVTGPK